MKRRDAARARARLQAAVRTFFAAREFEEVETPCLVSAPGMEPHIDAFEAPFLLEGSGAARPLWLHSSPEYAMKRLLAEGFPRIFQLARVFRNGEVSASHNPEFTMLEFYRAETDYRGIMADLEELMGFCARELTSGMRVRAGGRELELSAPFERLTVASAFRTRVGVHIGACGGGVAELRSQLTGRGLDEGRGDDSFEDLFFRAFLQHIEPTIGLGRPTYLVDWPAPMGGLSRGEGVRPP